MSNNRSSNRLLNVSPLLALLASQAAMPQDTPEDETLEQVVVTGTRVANRSALDTAAPVDVVSSESLQRIGVSEVNQALSVALPSFNFPRPGLADGTDTIRPATLRGLAPDQTLVLLNGKRRHSASLVNVNGTVGRGAAAVDLNTIPNAIVRSVEVLRDGASAQYGSDAIAGVINLRLREASDGGDLSVTYGLRESTYKVKTTTPEVPSLPSSGELERDVSDGETLTVSAWKGLPLGDNGFFTVAAEYKDQQHTERGGWDRRQQYPLLSDGSFDPRELTINRFNAWYGEPELDQKTVFINSGYDFESGARMYGWASWQRRDARSAGFYRRANDARNTIEIYPDGFLPIIAPEVNDYSAAFGVSWNLGAWDMDSSFVYGLNEMEFTIENTLNRSLGPASKTMFDAGGFDYDQVVYNLSGVRQVDIKALASPLNVALGVEARREGYSIFAGEPDSYRNGGVLLPGGGPTQSGAQVFPGFRPSDALNEHREAVGAYLDLEANLTEKFLASAAVRGEHYSDFGENVSGKLALRYDFTDSFALRASAQNGFRAPSLQQQFFAATSTNFNNLGVPFDVATFPVTSPVAIALGAKPLDAEESINYSVGAVLRLGDLSVTIDAYRIDIDDRIVLSENLTAPSVGNYLASQGFIGVGGGRFFLNGVDTTTEGVDLVMNYPLDTGGIGRFDFTLTANFNSTEVTRVPQIAQVTAIDQNLVLFDRLNIKAYEEGTPDSKFTAGINWSISRFGLTLRAIRYGETLNPANTANLDFVNEAATLVDVETRLSITDHINFAIGADNVLDEYPESFPANLNVTGNAPFSNYSAFGRSGRFVYGRLGVSF